MDDVFFLISDMSPHDGSYRILQSLSNPLHNSQVFVFVKDFELLMQLKQDCPRALYILLDQEKRESINKCFYLNLPHIDCYINYTGESFQKALKELPEISISREEYSGPDTLSIRKIHTTLGSNEEPGAALINVVHIADREDMDATWEKLFAQNQPPQPLVGPPYRFRKSPTPPAGTPNSDVSETQPLINAVRVQQDNEPDVGFFECLFCFWYTHCSKCCSRDALKFTDIWQLRCYIQMIHLEELKTNMETLMIAAETEYKKIVRRVEVQERKKLEELTQKVQDRMSQEAMELDDRRKTQNEATDANLSESLSDDVRRRIKGSREHQAESKLKFDSERSYREGAVHIRKGAEMELELMKEKHYYDVFVKQNEIMMSLSEKYRKKFDRLSLHNFGSFPRRDSSSVTRV